MSSATATLNPYEHLSITVRPDGSVTRIPFIPDSPRNPDGASGDVTVSKDVTVNSKTKVWAGIYRPPSPTAGRLPIIVYIHGGGFVLFSGANFHDHNHCSGMAAEIPAILVSVDHRLAPEHRLPAQYDDAVGTILWVKQQAADPHGEEWLRSYGDINRCYLIGRGSGANIAFHAGIRTAKLDLSPLHMCGMIMNQPMFSGKERSRSEVGFAADVMTPLPVLDLLWELALPNGSDRDHPFCNPKSVIQKLKDDESTLGIGKLLVIGFEMDPLSDKMIEFASELSSLPGLSVEIRSNGFGFHNMDIVDDTSFQGVLNVIKDFVTSSHH